MEEEEYGKVHKIHFDWWMFPIDSNPRIGCDVYTVLFEDIAELTADEEYFQNYREGVRFGRYVDFHSCASKLPIWLYAPESLTHSVVVVLVPRLAAWAWGWVWGT